MLAERDQHLEEARLIEADNKTSEQLRLATELLTTQDSVIELKGALEKAATVNQEATERSTKLEARVAELEAEKDGIELMGENLQEARQQLVELEDNAAEDRDVARTQVTDLGQQLANTQEELVVAREGVAAKLDANERADRLKSEVTDLKSKLAAMESASAAVAEGKRSLGETVSELETQLASAEVRPDLSVELLEAREEVAQLKSALALKNYEIASAMSVATIAIGDNAACSSTELAGESEKTMAAVPSSERRDAPYYFYRAMFDFDAADPAQLNLREGEELTVLSKNTSVAGWFKARNKKSKEDLVPSNYVQLTSVGAVLISDDGDEGDEGEMTDLLLPSGVIVSDNNSIRYPDGSSRQADGSVRLPGGSTLSAAQYAARKAGKELLLDGCVFLDDGCFEYPSGAMTPRHGNKVLLPDGAEVEALWQLPQPQPAIVACDVDVLEHAVSRLAVENTRLTKELDAAKATATALEQLAKGQSALVKIKSKKASEDSVEVVGEKVNEHVKDLEMLLNVKAAALDQALRKLEATPDLSSDLAEARHEIASLQQQLAAASVHAAGDDSVGAEELCNLEEKLEAEEAKGVKLTLKMMNMVSAVAEADDLRQEKEAQKKELDDFKRRNSLLSSQLDSARSPSKTGFFGKSKTTAEKDAMAEELALLRTSEKMLRHQKEIDDTQVEALQATVDELKDRMGGGTGSSEELFAAL
jgi:DNA repair exonuclease SbcCD ATPase subunit